MDNPTALYFEEVRKFNNKNVGQTEISKFYEVDIKKLEYMKYSMLEFI